MARFHFRQSSIVIVAVLIAFTFVICQESPAKKTVSSLSGQVIDAEGKPVAGLKLAVKPVKFAGFNDSLMPRTPFSSWERVVTDAAGRFSFHNIDAVSSHFAMSPEHGSDYEIISMAIGDLTFYSLAFRQNFPTYFGKLTFSVEPGEHLENVIVNVKPPRMRIRGRVLFADGTPLVNEEITISLSSRSYQTFPDGSRSRSGGRSTSKAKTDNTGYFIKYPRIAANYTVSMTYKGVAAQSDPISLEGGEPYNDLIFTLKDTKRLKADSGVWMINPANGNAYKKIQCRSWEDAKAKAKAEEAHLVAINDEAEQKWLAGLFRKKTFFWIGLSLPENATSWQWDSGQPLTYANWRTGQSSDNMPTGRGKVWVAMEFSAKQWVAIGPKSPFLPAVKHAILEKVGRHVPTQKTEN